MHDDDEDAQGRREGTTSERDRWYNQRQGGIRDTRIGSRTHEMSQGWITKQRVVKSTYRLDLEAGVGLDDGAWVRGKVGLDVRLYQRVHVLSTKEEDGNWQGSERGMREERSKR